MTPFFPLVHVTVDVAASSSSISSSIPAATPPLSTPVTAGRRLLAGTTPKSVRPTSYSSSFMWWFVLSEVRHSSSSPAAFLPFCVKLSWRVRHRFCRKLATLTSSEKRSELSLPPGQPLPPHFLTFRSVIAVVCGKLNVTLTLSLFQKFSTLIEGGAEPDKTERR